jgi:hypothetical protein
MSNSSSKRLESELIKSIGSAALDSPYNQPNAS